jgi:hypothetical protein
MTEVPQEIKKLVNGVVALKDTWADMGDAHYVDRELEILGYIKLGNGSYSIVYEHPAHPGIVFKITFNSKDGYHKYVEWIVQNRSKIRPTIRKHFPRIYTTYVAPRGVRVTVLQKLKPREYGHHAHEKTTTTESFNQAEQVVVSLAAAFTGVSLDHGGENIMINHCTAVITDPWSRHSYS